MQRIQTMRLMAVLVLLGALFAVASAAHVAMAVQPLAMAQTTSSVSSKAFLGTPGPDLAGAPAPAPGATTSNPVGPVRTGLVSPVAGAVVLVAVLLLAGGLLLWRRRTMSGA